MDEALSQVKACSKNVGDRVTGGSGRRLKACYMSRTGLWGPEATLSLRIIRMVESAQAAKALSNA